MRYMLFLVLLLITIAGCTRANLIAKESSKEYIEGYFTPTYTFNGTIPGPTLRGTVGEQFSIHVQNTLPEPITIHWHGVRLPNSMDGVPDVTQDPIQPGDDFVYSFVPKDPGVYWYHSHVDAHKQVEMGMQGALVVDDPSMKIPSDTTHVLVLDDVSINQDGTYRSFDLNYMHGRFGNILLVNGEQQPTFTSQGGRHRFQLVNTANARSFSLSFSGQLITVYGQDIGYQQPYTTKLLTMNPGERFDVVVESNRSFDIVNVGRQNNLLASINVQTLPYSSDTSEHLIIDEDIDYEELYAQDPELVLTLQGVRDPTHGLVWQINGTDSLTNPGEFKMKKGLTKIRLQNTQGQPHPMHLHGQKFKILQRNGITQENQGWKDTVMVGNREVVDLAVYVDEEGDWVFHCHILEHARAGMLATVKVEA